MKSKPGRRVEKRGVFASQVFAEKRIRKKLLYHHRGAGVTFGNPENLRHHRCVGIRAGGASCGSTGTPAEERIPHARRALKLYTGDLLPSLSMQQWVIQYSSYLRQTYLRTVKNLAATLCERGGREDLEETLDICNRAALLEPLHEELYRYIFNTMRRLDMKQAVLSYYSGDLQPVLRRAGRTSFARTAGHISLGFPRSEPDEGKSAPNSAGFGRDYAGRPAHPRRILLRV